MDGPSGGGRTVTGMERYAYHIDPGDQSTAAKVLRMVGHGKRVLELGTAVGSMTEVMREHYGCRVVGVEVDPAMAEQARPFCERLLIADLDTLDWANALGGERFDVVVAADVLEHLRDPWVCLRNIRDHLEPDGALVISVPNVAHGAVVAQLLAGRFPYNEKGLLDRTHLRFFSRADLEDMLLATGFLPVAWETNRIAVPDTELAGAWWALPEPLREHLSRLRDGTTYQFIVKAVPGSDLGGMTKLRADLAAAQVAVQREQVIADACRRELEAFRATALARQEELLSAYQDAERSVNETRDAYQKASQEYRNAYQEESARREDLERRLARQAEILSRQAEAVARLEAENARLTELVRQPRQLLLAAARSRVRRLFGRGAAGS